MTSLMNAANLLRYLPTLSSFFAKRSFYSSLVKAKNSRQNTTATPTSAFVLLDEGQIDASLTLCDEGFLFFPRSSRDPCVVEPYEYSLDLVGLVRGLPERFGCAWGLKFARVSCFLFLLCCSLGPIRTTRSWGHRNKGNGRSDMGCMHGSSVVCSFKSAMEEKKKVGMLELRVLDVFLDVFIPFTSDPP